MKIGIITRKDGYNIGSSLQAYAIYKTINDLGFEATVIDYCEYSRKARLRYFFLKVLFSICKKYSKYKKQIKQFDDFESLFTVTKKRFYNSVNTEITNDFDKFVCGSDQIWNPIQVRKPFLLDFVTDDKKRIAYAPSLGNVTNDRQLSEAYRLEISKFCHLSCREEMGASYIESFAKKKCKVVLDPTFLIERKSWFAIEKAVPKIAEKNFILCYFLGENNFPIEFINRLSVEKKMEIVNIQMFYNNPMPGAQNILASPKEFLWLLRKCYCCCTNSFHGTALSVNYNKLFYLFKRNYSNEGYDESSRFRTIIENLQLPVAIMDVCTTSIPYDMIDFTETNKLLILKKAESITYLKKAFNGHEQK